MKPSVPHPNLRVSVVMAIRNEENYIERCLTAILDQDLPGSQFEVLIADGCSTDRTREKIAVVASRYPKTTVAVFDNPGKIVSTGLNTVLQHVNGEYIVRVDGHTIIAPDYVRNCVAALETSGADNVGGRMDAYGRTPFAAAVALATSSPYGVGGARFHYSQDSEWVDTVYLGAWPRSVFQRLGGFDEEQVRNQDDEFNYRLREAGGKILLVPAIRSVYYNRGTPATLWKQYFQYGYWKVRVMQKHPRQMQIRQFVPPAFVLGWAALLLGSLIHPLIAVTGATLLCLYLVGCFTAALRCGALEQGVAQVLRTAAVFPILHVSYGCGFFRGLVKFRNRWGDKVIRQQLVLPA